MKCLRPKRCAYLPPIKITKHAKDRLKEYKGISEVKQVDGWQRKLSWAVKRRMGKGLRTDWEGAVHVRVEGLFAVCLLGGANKWIVKTVYPARAYPEKTVGKKKEFVSSLVPCNTVN